MGTKEDGSSGFCAVCRRVSGMDVLSVIGSRVSYRGQYENSPVPREDLQSILEAGLAAPSGCNKQTTKLIAVDDPERLGKLKTIAELPWADSAPAAIVVLTERVFAYRDKCFSIQDYSAAIENMLLAITALGYQGCWVEGHITDADEKGKQMASVLGVPDPYELVCYLPLGKAAEDLHHVKKQPCAERAWFNGYGLG